MTPNNLYREAKNQNLSRYGGYIYNFTWSSNIHYFVFWLILRDDDAVLISLITEKTYIEQLWRLVILLLKCFEFLLHLLVKIFLQNDSYVTTSFSNNGNLGQSVLYCANITLRMFGGYISVIGASTEAKTQVASICTFKL